MDSRSKFRIVQDDEEKQRIYRLRYQIYVEEMKRPQPHADHVKKLITEPLDQTAVLLGSFSEEGELQGTCRINFSLNSIFEHEDLYDFPKYEQAYPKRVAFISKMMVAKEYRKSIAFWGLTRLAYYAGLRMKTAIAILDCNRPLVKVFQSLGFDPYKGEVIHPLYGVVTPMALSLFDRNHLIQRKSPFLKDLDDYFKIDQSPLHRSEL